MYQSIRTVDKPIRDAQAVVCFVSSDGGLHPSDVELDRQLDGALRAAMKRGTTTTTTTASKSGAASRKSARGGGSSAAGGPAVVGGAAGANGETTVVFATGQRYMLLGVGELGKMTGRSLRAAAGNLVRALHRHGVESAHLRLSDVVVEKFGPAGFGQLFAEGLGLGAFTFDDFKGTLKKANAAPELSLSTTEAAVTKAMARGLALAESTNYARRLGATPPNVATTTRVAQEALQLAKASQGAIKCRVFRGDDLERLGLVGLINVGKASENPPCLIEMRYDANGVGEARGGGKKSRGSRPQAARNAPTVMLVGKTICYDTGGLSLKINNGMKGMKYDKNGGMAVLGAMHAIAHHVRPRCNVVAYLTAAENSISDEAYRPDDILTYLNGVTVEVTNTDAEGRLVLADALAYGCKTVKPDAIVDLATLTGGVITALGSACCGLFCEDDALRARIDAAAERSGERVWRLPLFEDYRELMKSKHADIWNSAPVRDAHPIQGAAFLSYFVEPGIPWAHLDIAGTSSIDKDQPPFAAGPTGYGVRLLVELLEAWE